ncbi:hypothetical protein G6F68_016075 [Rhizopus microsporus]|nr:hypothetical protein G6F68_016075 [Rhizopus microsporus]
MRQAPLLAGLAGDDARQLGAQLRPLRAIPLLLEIRVVDPAAFQQQAVELWFDGANGDVLAVGAGVAAVEVGAAIQHVGLALVDPAAILQLAVCVRLQAGRKERRRPASWRRRPCRRPGAAAARAAVRHVPWRAGRR